MESIRIIFTGRQYEEYICEKLKNAGFTVELTQESCDKGVDVIIRSESGDVAIQCKRYTQQPVGVDAVQEVRTGAIYYHCKKAVVVSPIRFTQQAEDLAESVGVDLLNQDEIVDRLSEFNDSLKNTEEYKEASYIRMMAENCDELKDAVLERNHKILSKLKALQATTEKAKRADVEALYEIACNGLEIERCVNDLIDRSAADLSELNVILPQLRSHCPDASKRIDEFISASQIEFTHIGVLQAVQQCKVALIDMSKKGNISAQSKLLELIKGRDVDVFVKTTFQSALDNDEPWVKNLVVALSMYGIVKTPNK